MGLRMKPIIIPGFKASGVYGGIKRRGKKDIALIFSEVPARVAGLFTTNRVKAAPVILDIERIKSGKGQAIVANSGNANACTGKRGYSDALKMVRIAAKELGISETLVYIASTGIIGRPLPMDKVRKGIEKGVSLLSEGGLYEAAEAVMTTDTFPKIASFKEVIGGKIITVAGIAKGSGMIHPQLYPNPPSSHATMLSFILTDVKIDAMALRSALTHSVENSFNRITVDGDTSTNDTVLCFANGVADNREIRTDNIDFKRFQRVLDKLTYSLARMIVMDGEGATKLIEVFVSGALTDNEAKRIAFKVANSNLVKTAFYGEDPNWGRIMAAIGSSGVDIHPDRINISFDGVRVVEKGIGFCADKEARRVLKKPHIRITIQLGKGRGKAEVLTTDLSAEYIKINSSYRS